MVERRGGGSARMLSLASGVLPEFGPAQAAAAAAAGGWEAVGLWVEPKTWTAATTREVARRLADGGLTALDVEVVWIRSGSDDPDHRRLIDLGAEVGAKNVLVVSSDPDRGATAAKFGRIVDHAAASGLRACLEFGAFTSVKSLADALDVLERCARPQAGLLVDPLHFARTGGAPADLAKVSPERFAYAQFCDAPASGPAPEDVQATIEEALDLRRLPGEGDLPLVDLLAALPPATPLSVELRSRALRESYPDAADRSRALRGATLAMLDRAPGRKPENRT